MSNLLPHQTKKIGWLITLLPLIVTVVIAISNKSTIEGNKELFKKIVTIGALLGLLIVILSKEKVDDEFITHSRLSAFAFSFITTIIQAIISLSGLINTNSYSPLNIILTMEVLYILWFEIQKRNLLRGAK